MRLRYRVEPGRRINDATGEIVVRDQALVMAVRLGGAIADEHLEPVVGIGDGHGGRRKLAGHLPQRVVGAADAPLASPVDVVFSRRLAGVEGMQRIGEIVTEHACGIDGGRPVALAQRHDEMIVPVARFDRCATPEIVARMEDVVGEVLEFVVRCLRAKHQQLGVLQKDAPPRPRPALLAVGAAHRARACGACLWRARRKARGRGCSSTAPKRDAHGHHKGLAML